MGAARLITGATLPEFFRDELGEAAQDLGVSIPEPVGAYLVELLVCFSKPENRPGDEALALMYKESLECDPVERLGRLRQLGDVALYSASFFSEWIASSSVDLDYYVSMGGGAYGTLSDLLQRYRKSGADTFDSLARDFSCYVGVLGEVCDRSRGNDDRHLVRMYDAWTKSGDERLRRKLLAKGLVEGQVPPEDLN